MNATVAAVAIAVALANPVGRIAPEIKVFTARAIATVLADIGGRFERATGYKLIVVSDLIVIGSAARATDTFSVCACPDADSEKSPNADTPTIARSIGLLM